MSQTDADAPASHESNRAEQIFPAGGGKDKADDAADYGRDRARAAQDRYNRANENYPSGGDIRREGMLPFALPVVQRLPFALPVLFRGGKLFCAIIYI